MLRSLRAAAALLFLAVNTVFWFVPIIVMAVLRWLVPVAPLQRTLARGCNHSIDGWAAGNALMLRAFRIVRIHAEVPDSLSTDQWHIVVSNHQTWGDILVLQTVLLGRVPALKFFMKRELLYIPLLGLAVWAMDFPIMHRYTRQYLARNPHKKGLDLEITRRKCARFRETPTSVMNFLEGTRFTVQKHARQRSPFRHLLRPKSGGFALALDALGGRIDRVVDVTIDYAGGAPGFWAFLGGACRDVTVLVRHEPIPEPLLRGSYASDAAFRAAFQRWVNGLWERKDRTLDGLRAPARGQPDRAAA